MSGIDVAAIRMGSGGYYVCKGCRRQCRARQRLCQRCAHELATGLYGGAWVQHGGIKRWVPEKKVTRIGGRPPKPLVMTEADRLRGRAEWMRGVRTPFTEAANREYQRLHKREARAA